MYLYQKGSRVTLIDVVPFMIHNRYSRVVCKNQQHTGMSEQFYTNIVMALKNAASEALPHSPQLNNVLGGTRM